MDSLADVDEMARGRVGRTLREKWRLDKLLGVGGMAAVYAGTHRNGKRGAVKVLHPELARSAEARARFLREGYVANTVGHPGAVAVIDDDTTEDGVVFMVMELLEGSTLDALAAAAPNRRLPLDLVLKAVDDLLDVLAAAHDKGVVHRDIKPDNLFVTRDTALKVLDFGIARLKQGDGSVKATRTGDAMGTPAFMPPEQALGNWSEVDGRTDLWAVGATMFTLLSGRFVHEADTVQKMMLAAMTRDAPPLEAVLSAPPPVCAVVNRALAKQRDQRFPDARAMQAAIRAARATTAGSTVSARTPPIVVTRDLVHPGAPTVAAARTPPILVATVSPTSFDHGAPAGPRRRAGFAPWMIGLVGVLAGLTGVGTFLLSRSPAAAAPSAAAPSTASSAEPAPPLSPEQPSAEVESPSALPIEPSASSSAAAPTPASRPALKGRLPAPPRSPNSAPTTFTGRK